MRVISHSVVSAQLSRERRWLSAGFRSFHEPGRARHSVRAAVRHYQTGAPRTDAPYHAAWFKGSIRVQTLEVLPTHEPERAVGIRECKRLRAYDPRSDLPAEDGQGLATRD